MLPMLRAFWTGSTTGEAAALLRIAFALLSLWTALGVGLNLERYYGPNAVVSWEITERFEYGRWTLFAWAPDSHALPAVVLTLLVVSALALLVGAAPRPAAVVLFVMVVSLHHRNPLVLNSGDRLFSILAGLMPFLPIDRRWALWPVPRPRAQSAPIWSIRLVQLQIAYVYWSSAFAKLENERWRSGWALRDVLASPVFAEWPTYLDSWPLVAALTWGTLLFELAFPVLIWSRRLRLWVIAAGVLFHLGIDLTMTIPMFSAVMIVSYAVFFEDDTLQNLLAGTRHPRARRVATSA
jgi:hypothetical protein